MTDLRVVVLIADTAQNGMAGDDHSIPEGLTSWPRSPAGA